MYSKLHTLSSYPIHLLTRLCMLNYSEGIFRGDTGGMCVHPITLLSRNKSFLTKKLKRKPRDYCGHLSGSQDPRIPKPSRKTWLKCCSIYSRKKIKLSKKQVTMLFTRVSQEAYLELSLTSTMKLFCENS